MSSFYYSVTQGDNPDEIIVYLYYNGMAVGLRYSNISDILTFIERVPEFLTMAGSDVNERFIKHQMDSLDEELPGILGLDKPKE